MTIGIDCRAIVNPGWSESVLVGHYALCLVEAMVKRDRANRYVLYVDRELATDAVAEITHGAPNVTVRRFPFHEFHSWMPGVYAKAFLPVLFAKDRLDVLFEPSGEVTCGFLGKRVVAVHDADRMNDDARGAKRFVVPSDYVKHELVKRRIDAKVIDVVPYGVLPPHPESADDIRVKYGITNRFVLCVGTVNARKNIHALVRAFVRLAKETPHDCHDLTLVLAGGKGRGSEVTFAEIDVANDELEGLLGRRAIRYIGYVMLEDKWELMRGATVFAYPAMLEGFGLPVLEAMSVGAPILASNRGGLPELVGPSGLLVDPEYTNDVYLGLARLLRNEGDRKHFSEAGKQRAERYTWDRAAEAVLKTLHKAMM